MTDEQKDQQDEQKDQQDEADGFNGPPVAMGDFPADEHIQEENKRRKEADQKEE